MNKSNDQQNESVEAVEIHEYLLNEIEKTRLNKTEIAKDLDVSRAGLYKVLRGEQKITRKFAQKLSHMFGGSYDFWLRPTVFLDNTADDQDNVYIFNPENTKPIPSPGMGNAPQLLTDNLFKNSLKAGYIEIEGYLEENLRPASYDLTLDSNITLISCAQKEVIDLSNKDFSLAQGQSIVAETREAVSLSNHFFARLGAISQHTKLGIFFGYGIQIDPGYSGKLQVSIFNAAAAPLKLFHGQRILSMEVYYIPQAPITTYDDHKSTPDLLEEISTVIEGQLTSTTLTGGKICIKWGKAGVECSYPADTADSIELFMKTLCTKLRGNISSQLESSLEDIASNISVEAEQLSILNELLSENSMHIDNQILDDLRKASEIHGTSETLWSICSQLDISVHELIQIAVCAFSDDYNR